VARDRLGALYVTAKDLAITNRRTKDVVAKLHVDGAVSRFAADLRDPQSVGFDTNGDLYVADGRVGRVWRFRAPVAPALEPAGGPTNQSPLTLRGATEADARIDVFVNEFPDAIAGLADATGKFAVSVPLAPNAVNTFAVHGTSHAGQGLTSQAAEAAAVHDAIAPSIVFQAPPGGGFVRQTVSVTVHATDERSEVDRVVLNVEGAALAATVAPPLPAPGLTATAAWNTSGVADGTHTLSATVTDRAGNAASATRIAIVDNTAPDTQITGGPDGDTTEARATFTFAGTDNLTPAGNLSFAWRVDGGAFGPFSSTTTADLTDLTEGAHTFEVTARDAAGNEDPTPARRRFRVTLGPSVRPSSH
jgi:hypothetical protein